LILNKEIVEEKMEELNPKEKIIYIYIYIHTPFGLNDWFIGILEDMKVSFIF
jgi:hypothetical protein